MRKLALIAGCVFCFSCAEFKPEEGAEKEPEKTEAAEPAKKTEKKKASSKPKNAPACDKLITTDDIKKVCKSDFELKPSEPDPNRPDKCSVRGRSAAQRMYFTISMHPGEDLAKAASKDVEPGATKVVESGGKSVQQVTVHARQDTMTLQLSSQVTGGGKGACTKEQMATLMTTAVGRLGK